MQKIRVVGGCAEDQARVREGRPDPRGVREHEEQRGAEQAAPAVEEAPALVGACRADPERGVRVLRLGEECRREHAPPAARAVYLRRHEDR